MNTAKLDGEWIQVEEPGYIDSLQALEEQQESEGLNKISFLKSADLIFDLRQGTITKGRNRVYLSQSEKTLLQALVSCPESTVSRSVLAETLQTLNNRSRPLMDNTLSVHFCRLRNSLKSLQSDQYIKTHHMFGYTWRYPVYKFVSSVPKRPAA